MWRSSQISRCRGRTAVARRRNEEVELKCTRIRLRAVHIRVQHAYCRREASGAFVKQKRKHKVKENFEGNGDSAICGELESKSLLNHGSKLV